MEKSRLRLVLPPSVFVFKNRKGEFEPMKVTIIKILLLLAIAMVVSIPVPSYVMLGILGTFVFMVFNDRIDRFVEARKDKE